MIHHVSIPAREPQRDYRTWLPPWVMTLNRASRAAAGCYEFDAKPIKFERLVATIRRVPT